MLTQNFVQMFKFWSSQFATLNHEQRGFYKEKVFVYSIYDMEIQKQPLEVFYKKTFLKILEYLQENTYVGVSF